VSTTLDDLAGKGDLTKEEACISLDKLIAKLNGLKRKVEESKREEDEHLHRFRSRLQHLNTFHNKDDPESIATWNGMRLDRVLVDFMLREGLYDTAIKLAQQANIMDLVDIDIFISSRKVIEGLTRHDCSEALQWCADNRSKLKKVKSNLEFSLRIQEFIELVRAQKLVQAIGYARKHLAPSAATNMKDIQKAMATLAFSTDTKCERYRPMFDPLRWAELIEQFKHDCYELFSLTSTPLLAISLEAGLSAIKTTLCGDPDTKNVNCPTCNEKFNKIAQVHSALHSHSRLVCRVTGEIMSDDNPPMVLPNNEAYSRKAIMQIAAKNNGRVICPKTGAVFKLEELKKAYIT